MRTYCKAYKLGDLRQFSDWSEKSEEHEPKLSDESVCYLWDDFVVVRSPVLEKGVLFDAVTPEWRDFCVSTLHFEIPEDLRSAYEQNESQEKTTA